MTVKTVSMGAPIRWFMSAIESCRKQPGTLVGGFAMLVLVALIPTVLQMLVQFALKPSPDQMLVVYAVFALLGLVLMPPLFAGGFRLVDACETGRPASAADIFSGYADVQLAIRMILTALAMLLAYAALGGLLMMMPAGDYIRDVLAAVLATPPGGQPDMSGLMQPPAGLGLWLLVFCFVALVLSNAYMLAFCQAALADRNPLQAAGDGFLASLKNLLPLLGFAILTIIVGFVAIMILAIGFGILFAVLSLVSPVLGMAVAAPIYLGMLLAMYLLMFGFYYHAWREMFGAPATTNNDSLAA